VILVALAVAGAVAQGEISLFRPQADILTSNVNIELAVAGVGGGKTMIGAFKTILRAYDVPTRHDQCHAVISPTFPMSKLGPEPKLLELIESPEIFGGKRLLVRHSKSDRCFYVRNRIGKTSKVRIFSGDDPNRWRGDEWVSGWFDEGDYLAKYGWTVGLGRLARTNGHALITTSPNGHGWVFEEAERCTVPVAADGYEKRVSPDGSRVLVRWGSLVNPFVSEAGYAVAASAYDEDTYRQEILAEFVAKAGRVYRSFDRTKHVKPYTLDKNAPVYMGADFNVGRMAWCAGQEIKAGPLTGLHVFWEQEIRDTDTRAAGLRAIESFKRLGIPASNVFVYPDAAGKQRKTSSDTSRTDLRILEGLGFRVRTPSSNPLIKDRVNCVNGLLHNGRLFVTPDVPKVLEALEKQPWDTDHDPVVPLKDGLLDNRTDALGYLCWGRFPLRGDFLLGGRRVEG
jgi:hypothetical protein